MSTKDRGITGQIIKVVHDNSHEKIEHKEGAEKNKGDKVSVG